MSNNIFIEILKYGRANPGFRYIDLVGYLNENNLKFESNDLPILPHTSHLMYVLLNFFQELEGKQIESVNYALNTSINCYLKPEALEYLLNYESFEQAIKDSNEARKDAQSAMKWVKYSFWASIVLSIISIVISLVKN